MLFASVVFVANAGLLTPGSQSGGILTPGLFKLVGSSLLPGNSSWILGTSTQRISEGWFGTLNANTSTIGTLTVSTSIGSGFTNGSVLFATSSGIISQDNSNFFWDDTNNRLGIGTAAPATKLHVVGASTFTDYMSVLNGIITSEGGASSTMNIRSNSGKSLSFGTNAIYDRMYIDTSGNVGIGTTVPGDKLHIVSTSAGAETLPLIIQNSDLTAGTKAGIKFVPSTATSRYSAIEGIQEDGANRIGMAFLTGAGATISEWMRINSTGNVGIGTTTPAYKLDITTTALGIKTLSTGGAGKAFVASDTQIAHGITYGSVINTNTYAALRYAYTNEGGLLLIGATERKTDALSLTGYSVSTGTDSGEGVIKISAKHGDASAFASLADTTKLLTVDNNATIKMTVLGSGNVGIGTTAPLQKLTIFGDPTDSNQPSGVNNATDLHTALFISGSGNNIGEKYGLQFGNYSTFSHSGIFGIMTSTSGNTQGDITFDTRSVTTDTLLTERMRIMSSGNVGIGTSTPASRLSIVSSGISSTTNALMVRNASSTEMFRVRDDGFVGIGTAAPAQKLDVTGNIRLPSANYLEYADGTKYYNTKLYVVDHDYNWDYFDGSGVKTFMFFESSNGNFGFATTTPNSTLQVNGTFALTSSSTVVTASIGGGALLAGACASATTTVDTSYTTSTLAFVTTPQIDPGDGFFWNTILQSSGVAYTRVCASVAGTPTASPYVLKMIK
jgi:hypothetical protein